jgi:hypothetical protein
MAQFQRAIGKYGLQLQAIQRLRLTDGLCWTDAHDIAMWCTLCGRNYETAQLSDKSIERITAIYNQYFTED